MADQPFVDAVLEENPSTPGTFEELFPRVDMPAAPPAAAPSTDASFDWMPKTVESGPVAVAAEQQQAEEPDWMPRTAPAGPLRDYQQLLSGGIARNWAQMRAAPDTWSAMAAELGGDTARAARLARSAQAIEDAAGHAQWSIKDIGNFEDFTYWLSEKVGENAVTMLAAALTGGTGLLVGRGLAAGLGGASATRAALIQAGNRGAAASLVGGATFLEAPGTALEQFAVTGSTQPVMSIGAGVMKGFLEAYTPMKVLSALQRPGRQLGVNFLGGVGTTAVREGLTEFGQEAIDVALRRYSDPNYTFGEAAWRLGEATAAGAAVGGVFGTVGSGIESYQNRQTPQDDGSGQVPGQIDVIQPATTTPLAEGEREEPVEAAVRMRGQLFTGYNHGTAFEKAIEHFGQKAVNEDIESGRLSNEALGGFVTNTGRWVSREEAARLVPEAGRLSLHAVDLPANNPNRVLSDADPAEPVEVPGAQLASVRVTQPQRQPAATPTVPEGALDEMNMIAPTPPSDIEFDIHTNKMGQTNVVIKRSGEEVGNAYVRSIRQSASGPPIVLQMGRITIADEHQRLGIGTALQERLEQQLGAPFAPDTTLSEEAYQRWRQIDPEAVEGYQKQKELWVLPVWDGRHQPNYYTTRMEAVRGALREGRYNQTVSRLGQYDWDRVVAGPITTIRNMLLRPREQDVILPEAAMPSPYEDLLGISPLLRSTPERQREAMLDWLEANTQRYAIEQLPGMFRGELFTDTDLELYTGLFHPQAQPPKIMRIDQGSLQAAGITAKPLDLAPPTSSRVWFLPNVTPETKQRLMTEYTALYNVIDGQIDVTLSNLEHRQAIEAGIDANYKKLVSDGLRIIPSRGSSFYYDLAMQGEEVPHPQTTGTSRQIAFMNPVNGQLFAMSVFASEAAFVNQAARPSEYSIPVAFDLNKFKKGELSALPENGAVEDGMSVQFAEKLTENEKTGLRNKMLKLLDTYSERFITEDMLLDQFRTLMKQGIWYKPEKNSSRLLTLEPIHSAKLVPGVDRLSFSSHVGLLAERDKTKSIHAEKAYQVRLRPGLSEAEIDVVMMAGNTPHKAIAEKITSIAKQMLPFINNLLKQLNMEGGVQIRITEDQYQIGPHARPNEAVIVLPPSHYGANPASNFEAEIYTTIMHELGHIVTLYHYSRLPQEVQQKIRYAYNQHLKVGRVAGVHVDKLISPTGLVPGSVISTPSYYLTFNEWLAEQFRRYTTTQDMIDELGKTYGDMAKRLEQFYHETEKITSKHITMDLFNPHHFFSAVMQYIQDFGSLKEIMKQRERKQALYMITQDVYENPVLLSLMQNAEIALRGMEQMIPKENTRLIFAENFTKELGEGHPDAVARAIKAKNLAIIELMVGALPQQGTEAEARVRITHELIHAYRMLGLLSEAEMEVLYQSAIKDNKRLPPEIIASLRTSVAKQAQDFGMTEQMQSATFDAMIREETVAYYVQEFANTGIGRAEAISIMQMLLDVLKRLSDQLFGTGFKTRDDLLSAIFRGEIAQREQRHDREGNYVTLLRNLMDPEDFARNVDDVREVRPGLWVGVKYEDMIGEDKNSSETIGYYFFESQTKPTTGLMRLAEGEHTIGKPLSFIMLDNRGPKGFEVALTESDGLGMLQLMKKYVEDDLGRPLLPSGTLTDAGYVFAKRAYPEVTKYYVHDTKHGVWLSPHAINRAVEIWTAHYSRQRAIVKDLKATDPEVMQSRERAHLVEVQKILQRYKYFKSKIDPEIWTSNKHLLDEMFSLTRNVSRDGTQMATTKAALHVEESKAQASLNASIEPGANIDPFEQTEREQADFLQSEGARRLGLPFEMAAPNQMETMYMRKIMERIEGFETSEDNRSLLKTSNISHEADRIGKFTRYYWGLHQMAWRNEHIPGVRDYLQANELFNQTVSTWHRDAGDIAFQWERSIPKIERREVLADFLFWLTEQRYNPDPIQSPRHPTFAEFQAEVNRRKFSKDELAVLANLYQHPEAVRRGAPKDIFGKFLDEVEAVSVANLRRRINDPARLQAALGKLNQEMNEMRIKPYFPMTRFGQYTITVQRSPLTGGKQTVWFAAYDTFRDRDSVISQVSAQFPNDEISIGRVPEEMFEFMGLPAPMIRAVRTGLETADPNNPLSATQEAWFEEFERMHTPDKTFRSKWKPRTGATQGHSTDAFRTFSHYFMNGARYLARMKHGSDMIDAINDTKDTLKALPNTSKRQYIIDYMVRHQKYIMESGKDYAKFKAFVALWQLGFSPAAAMMNLTQIPVVTFSYLSGMFNTGQATAQILSSFKAARNLKHGGQLVKGTGNYQLAREEVIKQGRIDIGQAAQLGAQSERSNLEGLLAGTKAQKFVRNVSWAGMWMFQQAEQINREVTFHAAWELAKANPTHKRMQEYEIYYGKQLTDLERRLSTPYVTFTRADAKAYLFAQEAVDRTQGIYAPYSRPEFLRKPLAGAILIFYQFVQLMTYVYRFNPGTVQLFLMSAALFGLAGLPGSDDLNNILKAVGRRLFGQDWDVHKAARKYARDLTRGTLFDEVGPDLLLHGISRYGFGLGLMPEGYALGKFDASGNGSLGKLVPGLSEAAHGFASYASSQQIASDVISRLAGAGYGYMFALNKYGAESGGTTRSHTWESLLPRAARAVVKANRLYGDQGEVTRTGARIVRMDRADPEDMASIVTQALGFAPTKTNATWEMLREQRSELQVFKARRLTLYSQFDYALQSGRPDLHADVVRAIREYNAEVRPYAPSMQIQPEQITQSLRQRQRARAMQEQLLPVQRSQIPVAREVLDLFPNVRPQVVR